MNKKDLENIKLNVKSYSEIDKFKFKRMQIYQSLESIYIKLKSETKNYNELFREIYETLCDDKLVAIISYNYELVNCCEIIIFENNNNYNHDDKIEYLI